MGKEGGYNKSYQKEGISSSYNVISTALERKGLRFWDNKGKAPAYVEMLKQIEYGPNQREVLLALKGACALPKACPMRLDTATYRKNGKYCEYTTKTRATRWKSVGTSQKLLKK